MLESGSRLSIFFDAPSFRAVRFLADGRISVDLPSGIITDIGPFIFGEKIELSVTADLNQDLFSVVMNGRSVHLGSFAGAISLNNIRLAAFGRVAVDDIRVTVIPEPATGLLMGLGLALLAGARPRRPE